jgi:hypothetical protein
MVVASRAVVVDVAPDADTVAVLACRRLPVASQTPDVARGVTRRVRMAAEHNALKTILSLGEEAMGDVVKQLLANEGFVAAMQKAVVGGISAKRNIDKGLVGVFGLVNIPTVDDVDKVRSRLAEVEELVAELTTRLEKINEQLDADD